MPTSRLKLAASGGFLASCGFLTSLGALLSGAYCTLASARPPADEIVSSSTITTPPGVANIGTACMASNGERNFDHDSGTCTTTDRDRIVENTQNLQADASPPTKKDKEVVAPSPTRRRVKPDE